MVYYKLSEDRFLLGIESTDLHGNMLSIDIEFSAAEVLRI